MLVNCVNIIPGDPTGLPDVLKMKSTIIFIDGGYLSFISKFFGKGKPLKYKMEVFAKNLAKSKGLECKKICYYTAPPYQSPIPEENEKRLMKNYKNLSNLLQYKKWITVREGRCQRLKLDGEYQYKQKGVDILISIDLMQIKENYPDIKKIILIACDSDFVPLIKNLQDNNIEVILYTYFNRNRNSLFSRYNELLQSCNKWEKLKTEDFE